MRKYRDELLNSFFRRAYKEQQFDILADEVRKSLNMELLYKMIEEGLS